MGGIGGTGGTGATPGTGGTGGTGGAGGASPTWKKTSAPGGGPGGRPRGPFHEAPRGAVHDTPRLTWAKGPAPCSDVPGKGCVHAIAPAPNIWPGTHVCSVC